MPRQEVEGQFDYLNGAIYKSPLFSNYKYSSLVDAHESTHRYLSMVNFIDGIGRLLATVLSLSDSVKYQLSRGHYNKLKSTLHLIHKHTSFIHEVVATYESFRLFAHTDLGRNNYSEARRLLPKSYEKYLTLGERGFGKIESVSFGRSPTGPIVYATALSALNICFDPNSITLKKIDEFCTYLRKNSPNKRFRSLLKKLRSSNDQSIFSDLEENYDYYGDPELFQRNLHNRIRTFFPEIVFRRKVEYPNVIEESLKCLQEDLLLRGYDFANELAIKPPVNEELPTTRFGSKNQNPQILNEKIQDASIYSISYRRASIELVKGLILNVSNPDSVIFTHVLPSKTKDDNQFTFLSFGVDLSRNNSNLNSWACALECSFEDWKQMSFQIQNDQLPISIDRLVLKFDSQVDRNLVRNFAKIGHPIFIFVNHPSDYFIQIVKEWSKDIEICVTYLKVSEKDLRIFIVHIPQEQITLLTPCTELGVYSIEEEIFQVFESPIEITSYSWEKYLRISSENFLLLVGSWLS